MGIFDKVKDVVGDVVDGIVDGIDKITGIDLKKILNNKWVKGGLMAASLATGGIAIVNGVMTGFNAASGATGFMGKFVEGASGFVQGAAQGLANPMQTGKSILGVGGEATASSLAAAGQTGADIAPESLIADGAGDAAQDALVTTEGVASAAAPPIEPLSAQTQIPDPAAQLTQPAAGDPLSYGGGDANVFTDDGFAAGSSFPGAGGGPTDALANQIQQGEQGWLQQLASGAKDFVTSPQGMMTAAKAASGWAQGKAIEERWDEMQKQEKQRRRSYEGFSSRAPQLNIPSLSDLRKRSSGIQHRGDQAQSKYGYGGA